MQVEAGEFEKALEILDESLTHFARPPDSLKVMGERIDAAEDAWVGRDEWEGPERLRDTNRWGRGND